MNELTFRENYDKKVNKNFLFILAAHIPFFVIMAWFFKTEYTIATLLPLFILAGPIVSYWFKPHSLLTSCLNAFATMCMSAIMIHLGKGMIEMHFHIFAFMSLLIICGYITPILFALVTVAIHHISFFFLFPKSLFNYEAGFEIVILHAVFATTAAAFCSVIAKKYGAFINVQDLVMNNLKKSAESSQNMAHVLSQITEQVSESTDHQSSSVQETAATLEQITKMVEMTTRNISETKSNSTKSFEAAKSGKISVNKVTDSIKNISQSNQNMIKQMENNVNQIQEFTTLINKIAEKTHIINDIVFQTKLLSFNASVEAARAGEHGKGFAVVAEEIGNLAQMSGTASDEINSLLENSINRVNTIVDQSKKEMELISKTGTIVLDNGIQQSNDSLAVIDNVVSNINKNQELMDNISNASEEQSKGVKEISVAIKSINVSNQEKIKMVKQLNEITSTITEESNNLHAVVENIELKLHIKKAS